MLCRRRNLELRVIVRKHDDCNNKSSEGDRHIRLSSRLVISTAKFGHTTVSLPSPPPTYTVIAENTDLSILFTKYHCVDQYNDKTILYFSNNVYFPRSLLPIRQKSIGLID